MMKIKEAVYRILSEDERARNNDNYLIYRVYKLLGLPTDLETIAESGENKFETIRRYRAKAQEQNPLLRASEKTTKKRQARQEQFYSEMRGI